MLVKRRHKLNLVEFSLTLRKHLEGSIHKILKKCFMLGRFNGIDGRRSLESPREAKDLLKA